jgi:CPA2 family monovalent cation:H+ antiporter-2
LAHSAVFYDVLVFLLAAVIVVPALRYLKSSPVLGYLVAGILVGPHGLAFISESENASILAEFGVIFLLFMIGLELSFGRLRSLGRYVFGLGSLQVVVTALLIGGIVAALGMSGGAAAIIGGGLALSSTAFVLQLLIERNERATMHGNVAFAILLLQDLAIVPLLMLVTVLGEGDGNFAVSLLWAAAKAVLALVAVLAVRRIVLRPVYRVIAATRSAELFVAMTLLVVLGTGWFMSLSGVSMALGAFLAGLLLAETEFRHQVETDIRPFRGILLGLFFMTVGMSVDITLIGEEITAVAMLLAALLVGKTVVIAILCRLFGVRTVDSGRVGLLLAQGGEFGFILFIAASGKGILSPQVTQVLLATVTLSMAVTPLLAYLGGKLLALLARKGEALAMGPEVQEELLRDHIVLVGYGRVGQTVASVLSEAGISYVALDMDPSRIRECRVKGMPVYFGDASRVEILKAVGIQGARAVVVTLDRPVTADLVVATVKALFPDIPIFARARDLPHSRRLQDEGLTEAVPETLEASLQLGAITAEAMGASADEVTGIIQKYRQEHYGNVEEI